MHSIFYLKFILKWTWRNWCIKWWEVFHTSAFGNLNFANIIIGKARIFIIKREERKKETNKQRNKSKRKRERKGFSKYKIKRNSFYFIYILIGIDQIIGKVCREYLLYVGG